MRIDHLHAHLSRRKLLEGAAKLGAAGAAANLLAGGALAGIAGAAGHDGHDGHDGPGGSFDGGDGHIPTGLFDDSFSPSGAADGSWKAESTARYGADDQRGTLNEVDAVKTAKAMALLAGAKRVVTYNMGHTMRNGNPAFVTFPPRRYQQRLTALGYTPSDPKFFTASPTATGFEGEDEWRAADRANGPLGYLQGATGIGPNNVSVHEERFPEGFTYQISTQLDNLNHVGVGAYFYNGNMGPDIATATGTTRLGMEHVGAFVTRGILIDVLGYKQKTDPSAVITVNGNPMLSDTYRITVADLQGAMKWEGLRDGVTPGDVVVIRSGWNMLAEDPDTYDRYLAGEPGIHVAESKFLSANRPAVIAADSWGLEVVGNTTLGPNAFPVHQLLLARWGVRIGEGVVSDDLAADGVHEFVYFYSPMVAEGATAGGTPPVALAKG